MYYIFTSIISGCCILSTPLLLSITIANCNKRKQNIIDTNSQKKCDYVEYKYHDSMMNFYKIKLAETNTK
jgi:hypothetical protein